jgi:hypothetical protein
MTKNNTSSKLKKIVEKDSTPAEDILRKIRANQDPKYEADRKKSQKFVEEYIKNEGKIRYFREDWRGTKVWEEAHDEGYGRALWESEDEHKDIIYKLVKKLTA